MGIFVLENTLYWKMIDKKSK